jgi:hypothetical protein
LWPTAESMQGPSWSRSMNSPSCPKLPEFQPQAVAAWWEQRCSGSNLEWLQLANDSPNRNSRRSFAETPTERVRLDIGTTYRVGAMSPSFHNWDRIVLPVDNKSPGSASSECRRQRSERTQRWTEASLQGATFQAKGAGSHSYRSSCSSQCLPVLWD